MAASQHLDNTRTDLRGTNNSAQPDGRRKLEATRLQQWQKVDAKHREDRSAQGEYHREKRKYWQLAWRQAGTRARAFVISGRRYEGATRQCQ